LQIKFINLYSDFRFNNALTLPLTVKPGTSTFRKNWQLSVFAGVATGTEKSIA